MINYARHDEEFHGVIKLNNGEEILGKAILTEDNGETLIFISEPVQIQNVMKELPDGKVVKAMGFSRWMQFSEEDFYILREKDVITVASMSNEVVFMYETYISDDGEDDDSRLKESRRHVTPDTKMGYLGKIDEARSKLEKIFRNQSHS
jgi:hypothetical protein|tara:strand:+ start:15 stop:461 length:447 start_codon:yes stop_codon:yes gene_type:complete